MTGNQKKISSIVIAGGGTAGWMTAAGLSQHFANTGISIEVIESSAIGSIGVGEATIPTLRRFYQKLGMDDLELMKATQATVKLGIEFQDWYKKGTSFIHPFGLFGQRAHGIPFHHYWNKLRKQGDASDFSEYSLGVALAQAGKFTFPSENPTSALSVFDWALHFDAALFAQVMRAYSEKNGTGYIDAKILGVNIDNDSGFIRSLTLDDGREITADLFIDCTGFSALLIEQAQNTGYEDWSRWLFCDRALAVQSELVGDPVPRTVAKAHEAGWQWRIPLRHRQGNGHVYSSRFSSDAAAEDRFLMHIDGAILNEPRRIKFTPGRRKQAWNKNCIAIGLAAGFLEPLESTSIALIETAIEKICASFSEPYYNADKIQRFNEVTAIEYERVRDFIILHYKASQRDDNEFWRQCGAMSLPDTLQKKLDAYLSRGEMLHYSWEMFHPDSWLAIYTGFGLFPERYDARVDAIDVEYIKSSFSAMRSSIRNAVASVTAYDEFIKMYL